MIRDTAVFIKRCLLYCYRAHEFLASSRNVYTSIKRRPTAELLQSTSAYNKVNDNCKTITEYQCL